MSEIINAVIIDDDINFIIALKTLLDENFPQVNVIGKITSVRDAITFLNISEPKLVFLDIMLLDGTAFDILEAVENRNFEIIFTTASSEFALKAFEFAAMHYLIKPIALDELQNAMERFFAKNNIDFFDEKINVLKNNLNHTNTPKILLSFSEGMSLYNIYDIVRCESEGNYTNVYLANKTKILATKPLINFTKLLKSYGFARIHNQHLINLKYLTKYSTGQNQLAIIEDGAKLPVSRSYRAEFANELKRYAQAV